MMMLFMDDLHADSINVFSTAQKLTKPIHMREKEEQAVLLPKKSKVLHSDGPSRFSFIRPSLTLA